MEGIIHEYLLHGTLGKIVSIAIGTAILWAVLNVLKGRLTRLLSDNEGRYRANKMVDFVGLFLFIVLVSIVFSDNLGGFTVALGVAGAGIAFSLQEVITSFAGWLAIMFGGFYKTGDRVQLGGIKGDVIDVGVLRTTVMEIGQWVDGDLYNGRIVRIANSFVFKEPVFNYSGDFPFIWDEVKVPVMYGSSYAKATALFQQIVDDVTADSADEARDSWAHMVGKYMIEHVPTKPSVTLAFNDNWVEYTIRYVTHYRKRRATKNDLFTRILLAVEATNNEIKFASATFQLVEAPEIRVSLVGNPSI